MSEQLSLEVQPRTLAHTDDPAASVAAATRGSEKKRSGRRACLLAHAARDENHETEPGLTDDEVSAITGIELHEARRRCTDLRNAGLIEFLTWESMGYIARRPHVSRDNAQGNRATVSIITRAGREALA